MRTMRNRQANINSGSMADIAFLLLIFFLVTTTINQDMGLYIILPPHQEDVPEISVHDRNLLSIHLNSEGNILLEKKLVDIQQIPEELRKFLLNPQNLPHLSESPSKAVVSLKVSRTARHKDYIDLLDEIFAGYKIAQSNSVSMSPHEFSKLDQRNPEHLKVIQRARRLVPRQLSIAESY